MMYLDTMEAQIKAIEKSRGDLDKASATYFLATDKSEATKAVEELAATLSVDMWGFVRAAADFNTTIDKQTSINTSGEKSYPLTLIASMQTMKPMLDNITHRMKASTDAISAIMYKVKGEGLSIDWSGLEQFLGEVDNNEFCRTEGGEEAIQSIIKRLEGERLSIEVSNIGRVEGEVDDNEDPITQEE